MKRAPGRRGRLNARSSSQLESDAPSRRIEHAVLALLIILVSAIHLNWIRVDESPQPYGDSYIYLTKLFRFMEHFDAHSFADPGSSLESLSFSGRPPLYQLLTIPFILLFGRSEDVALLVNVLFLVILVVSTYNIGRFAGNGKAGLLAALLVVAYPPMVHLSRAYIPHFATPSCGALSLWLLLLLMKTRSIKIAWLFASSLAFGLLIHPRFLVLLGLPTVIFGLYMLLFQERPRYPAGFKDAPAWALAKLRDPLVTRGLVPGALLTATLTLSWYLTWGSLLLVRLQKLSAAELADFRGVQQITVGFSDLEPSFWWYAQTAPGALSNVLAVFALVGLVMAAVRWRFLTGFLSVAFICAYVMLNSQPALAWWNFSCTPAAAALTALWVTGLRRQWLSHAMVAVCVVVAVFNFSTVTWGVSSWSQPVAVALGAPLSDRRTCGGAREAAFCPAPARAARGPLKEVQAAILDDPKCRSERPCTIMIVPRGAGMKRELFDFLLVMNQLQDRIHATSPRTRVNAHPYNLKGLLESDYLLYPDVRFPQSVVSYNAASVRFLQSPPAAFAEAHSLEATFELPTGRSARLVKRVRPLTLDEAEATIASLALPEVYLSERLEVLERLYADADDPGKKLVFYEEALRRSTDKRMEARARHRVVEIYRELGQTERAASLLQEGLGKKPGDVGARVQLAESLAELGKTDEAAAELGLAIEMAPGDFRPRRALADLHRELGESEQAVLRYREVLELNPEHLASRIRLAVLYREAGKTDAAIAELEIAIDLAPERFWPRHLLADLYQRLGDTERTVAIYEEFLKIDPENVKARKALARIKKPEE